jgi:hypothetical protein
VAQSTHEAVEKQKTENAKAMEEDFQAKFAQSVYNPRGVKTDEQAEAFINKLYPEITGQTRVWAHNLVKQFNSDDPNHRTPSEWQAYNEAHILLTDDTGGPEQYRTGILGLRDGTYAKLPGVKLKPSDLQEFLKVDAKKEYTHPAVKAELDRITAAFEIKTGDSEKDRTEKTQRKNFIQNLYMKNVGENLFAAKKNPKIGPTIDSDTIAEIAKKSADAAAKGFQFPDTVNVNDFKNIAEAIEYVKINGNAGGNPRGIRESIPSAGIEYLRKHVEPTAKPEEVKHQLMSDGSVNMDFNGWMYNFGIIDKDKNVGIRKRITVDGETNWKLIWPPPPQTAEERASSEEVARKALEEARKKSGGRW